jgi:hypothetical protein
MSVQPYTSPYAPPLSNSGGGGSGDTVPANSSVPDLAMVWQSAPDIIAAPASGSGDEAPVTVLTPEFTFDFGQFRAMLTNMLEGSSNIVQAYENLKSQFESVQGTVFGQTATITTTETVQGEGGKGEVRMEDDTPGEPTLVNAVSPDPLQAQAQQYANGGNGQPGMNDIQAFTLQSIGNAMAVFGEFMATMQAIAVSYADADLNSVLPPVNVSQQQQ